ncbi:TRAP transporter substrate-binding protein [Rhodobacter sp. Har01]|uniref:TRAP transporter substrate-binding protein n=1 Tax=Rhodobacter sp. Har01 TaxID=2883999 RepID=UPI001D063365|nr:TRAP transporter substrate-binding protein [Rhodobacter sp. Har01]MCB6179082.1 TRAP transporter substrate-binding protein [Rhodobacter sp. Har01]
MRLPSLSSALAASVLALMAAAADAETLRLAHESSSGSLIQKAAEMFAQKVAEKSGGALEVQIFPEGQLGDEAAIADGVGAGSIDIGLGGVADAIDPRLNVVTLPFLFKDLDAVHAFLDGPVGQEVFATGGDNGFHMLGALDSGFRQFALTKGPVTTPADLAGVKVRTPPNPVLLATMNALGALAQSIPFGEVYTSLQSGVVDGVEPEMRDFQDQKWYEVTKYLSVSNYVWTPNYWFINAARYDGLDEAGRAAIDAAAAETTTWYRGELAATYDKVLSDLAAAGVTVNTVDQAPFKAMVGPVYEQFGKEWGADYVAKVVAAAAGG